MDYLTIKKLLKDGKGKAKGELKVTRDGEAVSYPAQIFDYGFFVSLFFGHHGDDGKLTDGVFLMIRKSAIGKEVDLHEESSGVSLWVKGESYAAVSGKLLINSDELGKQAHGKFSADFGPDSPFKTLKDGIFSVTSE